MSRSSESASSSLLSSFVVLAWLSRVFGVVLLLGSEILTVLLNHGSLTLPVISSIDWNAPPRPTWLLVVLNRSELVAEFPHLLAIESTVFPGMGRLSFPCRDLLGHGWHIVTHFLAWLYVSSEGRELFGHFVINDLSVVAFAYFTQ